MSTYLPWCLLLAVAGFSGCAGGNESASTGGAETKESIFGRGHQLYLSQNFDSASAVLKRAADMDPSYADPRTDLADLYYTEGMKQSGASRRVELLRRAQNYFAELESMGKGGSDIYERLCETSLAIRDDKSMLKYARLNAEKYPYDRQYHNLGIACLNAGDYAGVVKSQKEAIEKFKESPFLGGFYRQTGRAYEKMDRDQTAERTFEAGVKAVDARLAEVKRSGQGKQGSEESRRLLDDKIAMLLELRHLHRTYQETAKLQQIERQLREAGYTK